MDTLIVEGVRCFADRIERSLAPLTLLVGENSSGKSTFLAATRLASDLALGTGPLNFNEEPFQLGAYDTIAHHHGGQGRRVKSFTLGGRYLSTRSGAKVSIEGRFVSERGQPALSEYVVLGRHGSDPEIELHWQRREDSQPGSIILVKRTAPNATPLELPIDFGLPFSGTNFPVPPSQLLLALLQTGKRSKAPALSSAELAVLGDAMSVLFTGSRPRALAPIRVRPLRTYDPIREHPDPEGAHIPVLLSQIFSGAADPPIAKALGDFGRASGLFETLEVRHLGKRSREADPFQIELKIRGQKGKRNILDVGYGVSQVLPVLVELLTGDGRSTFLLQQPEVHLHPRAQAELGTLFATLVANGSKLIVETHSDYLVDRVLLAVRNKILPKEKLAILFFETSERKTSIHQISVDESGEIVTCPDSYRRFFHDEQRRILGV